MSRGCAAKIRCLGCSDGKAEISRSPNIQGREICYYRHPTTTLLSNESNAYGQSVQSHTKMNTLTPFAPSALPVAASKRASQFGALRSPATQKFAITNIEAQRLINQVFADMLDEDAQRSMRDQVLRQRIECIGLCVLLGAIAFVFPFMMTL